MHRSSPKTLKPGQRQAPQRRPHPDASQQRRVKVAAPEGYVYIREASRLLGRNMATLYRWIQRGWLQAALIGFRCYVKKECVDWWLAPHPYTGRPPVPPWLAEAQLSEQKSNTVQNTEVEPCPAQ